MPLQRGVFSIPTPAVRWDARNTSEGGFSSRERAKVGEMRRDGQSAGCAILCITIWSEFDTLYRFPSSAIYFQPLFKLDLSLSDTYSYRPNGTTDFSSRVTFKLSTL